MINLLIAIIISNFDNSRRYSTKMRMINLLKEQLEDGKSHYDSVIQVLGEVVAQKAFQLERVRKSSQFKSAKLIRMHKKVIKHNFRERSRQHSDTRKISSMQRINIGGDSLSNNISEEKKSEHDMVESANKWLNHEHPNE